jgi:endopeptidase Clp ATP-binding regulatory subunit ClpX
MCDHYNHIRKVQNNDSNLSHYYKQNVLMLGPTGVGKTYLVKKLAQLVGVPFVRADATKFTEAGYVGANVEDTIRDLVVQADGNIELAQYGIVYIDEADKLAGSRKVAGKDISGRGVQNGMLKLLEETEVDAKSPFDMMAQMNSMIMGGKEGKPKTINTKNILFIFSGAFHGLEDIIKKRLNANTIGLNSTISKEEITPDYFSLATTKDLLDFGLESELIGRLPVRVHLNDLTKDQLYQILTESKESILFQYEDAFESYAIKINFTEEALREIATQAFQEKTGARSLMTIIEKSLRDFKFELPSLNIDSLEVTLDLINNPKETLQKMIKEHSKLQ